ncbi:hypothetical protein ACGFIY_21020 [Micromonospora chersina]|uniref:hypothetical protein n=1 Tax=Micromonospora chersina TaxID=47854 RepID=UPI00371A738B
MNGTITAEVTAEIERPMPPQTPGNPFPTPWPGGPTYSALDLMGEVYLGLWSAGKIPAGPMRDPEGAQRACVDLLRAFGVTPTSEATNASRAAGAVAAVCGASA